MKREDHGDGLHPCPKAPTSGRLATRAAITAFSLGVGDSVRPVVPPPESVVARDSDPTAFERALHGMRDGARKLMTKLAEASAAAGPPAWGLK